jgi:hypothetical protein
MKNQPSPQKIADEFRRPGKRENYTAPGSAIIARLGIRIKERWLTWPQQRKESVY